MMNTKILTLGCLVGMVWLAVARRGADTRAERLQLDGGRAAVRGQTVTTALQRLIDAAGAG